MQIASASDIKVFFIQILTRRVRRAISLLSQVLARVSNLIDLVGKYWQIIDSLKKIAVKKQMTHSAMTDEMLYRGLVEAILVKE